MKHDTPVRGRLPDWCHWARPDLKPECSAGHALYVCIAPNKYYILEDIAVINTCTVRPRKLLRSNHCPVLIIVGISHNFQSTRHHMIKISIPNSYECLKGGLGTPGDALLKLPLTDRLCIVSLIMRIQSKWECMSARRASTLSGQICNKKWKAWWRIYNCRFTGLHTPRHSTFMVLSLSELVVVNITMFQTTICQLGYTCDLRENFSKALIFSQSRYAAALDMESSCCSFLGISRKGKQPSLTFRK